MSKAPKIQILIALGLLLIGGCSSEAPKLATEPGALKSGGRVPLRVTAPGEKEQLNLIELRDAKASGITAEFSFRSNVAGRLRFLEAVLAKSGCKGEPSYEYEWSTLLPN